MNEMMFCPCCGIKSGALKRRNGCVDATANSAEGKVAIPLEDLTPWSGGDDYDSGYQNGLVNGWNACREAMLNATPSIPKAGE